MRLMTTALLAILVCGCVEVFERWDQYPFELTEEHKAELLEAVMDLADSGQPIDEDTFNGAPREFLFYFLNYAVSEELRPIEDLVITTIPASQIFDTCYEDPDATACYHEDEHVIFMPDNLDLATYFELLAHELGHFYDHGELDEYMSMSFEMLSQVKLYEFAPEFGLLSLGLLFGYTNDRLEYTEGTLYTALMVAEEKGNIEEVWQGILRHESHEEIDEELRRDSLIEGCWQGDGAFELNRRLWDEALPLLIENVAERRVLETEDLDRMEEMLDYILRNRIEGDF